MTVRSIRTSACGDDRTPSVTVRPKVKVTGVIDASAGTAPPVFAAPPCGRAVSAPAFGSNEKLGVALLGSSNVTEGPESCTHV